MNWKARIAKTLASLLIAVVPAAFGYCQARTEMKEKWLETQQEASQATKASYDELASAVKELQDTVQKQHDDILKIQVYTNVLEDYLSATENRINPGRPSFFVSRPKEPTKPVLTTPRDYRTLIRK